MATAIRSAHNTEKKIFRWVKDTPDAVKKNSGGVVPAIEGNATFAGRWLNAQPQFSLFSELRWNRGSDGEDADDFLSRWQSPVSIE